MTDYDKLVATLRETAKYLDGISRFPYDDDPAKRIYSKKMTDAADAIEALQAEIRESMQRCAECGDELEQQMPKRGEIVRCGECKWWREFFIRGVGRGRGVCYIRTDPLECNADWFCADGEKMEVQDGK